MTFQEMILALQQHWAAQGCILTQAYDVEVGAGTMAPTTFLRALGPEPWNVAYVQPSRRPKDGRYGENPNRLQHYYQFQVIMKPSPEDAQELLLGSYRELGLDPAAIPSGPSRTPFDEEAAAVEHVGEALDPAVVVLVLPCPIAPRDWARRVLAGGLVFCSGSCCFRTGLP